MSKMALPLRLFDNFLSEWPEIEERAVTLLQKLIQTDTQNFGEEGTETKAVEIIEEHFKNAGVPYEIVEPKPGRGNIIARLNGDGSSGQGALCLSAHLDTVRAPTDNWKASGWKHDPYAGIIDEEDGCLYGRGAIDMKHMVAMSVILMCLIKEKGIILPRDLIFAGVADEERVDSTYGVKYLIENRPELIKADIVITELGGVSFYVEDREVFSVMIGEKGLAKIKITAKGPGGHGSIYHNDNPIARVGDVASTLAKNRLPLRIVPAGRATVESIASQVSFLKGLVLQNLLSPHLSDYVADHVLDSEQRQAFLPTLHNTANATVIGGGDQPNQIPTEAWVLIDSRILPGCTIEDIQQDIQSVLGPEKFKSQTNSDGEEVPPELHMEVQTYRYSYNQDPTSADVVSVLSKIRQVIAERANGASIITNLLPGGTDLTFYAMHPTKTPICIGFTPIRFPPDMKMSALFHGVNERIPVDGFKWGLRTLADVVALLCITKI